MSSEEIAPPLEENPYSVGTLTYTAKGLRNLFWWILWGDFAYTIMEATFPRILKLFMLSTPGGPEGGLGASNTVVTWLTVIIPQILGVLICPAVSFRSDRCRSKWGRRIPYMLFSAPALAFFLTGMGFSRQISNYFVPQPAEPVAVSATVPAADAPTAATATSSATATPTVAAATPATTSATASAPTAIVANVLEAPGKWVAKFGISPMMASLIVIGFFIVGFRICYEIVGSVYWYLLADVVPSSVMGRFLGLFRVVGQLAAVGFGALVIPYSLRHMDWVHGGIAVIYLVVFILMCLKIKEGKYPPVTDVTESTSVWEQINIYMKECFSHPIYIFIFVGTGLFGISTLVSIGADVFAKDALGVSMAQIGYVTAVAGVLSAAIMYPCGWLSDKFHPLPVTIASVILIAIINVISTFLMVGPISYWILTIVTVLLNGVYFAAGIPLLMALLPKSRFGQFCSANGTFKSVVLVVFGLVTGEFLDWMTHKGKVVDNYRYGFLCVGICFVLYLITLLYVTKYWKQLGGRRGYIAPGVEEEAALVHGQVGENSTPKEE